jgi:hypothetical protein
MGLSSGFRVKLGTARAAGPELWPRPLTSSTITVVLNKLLTAVSGVLVHQATASDRPQPEAAELHRQLRESGGHPGP